jgi:hypothetical protein
MASLCKAVSRPESKMTMTVALPMSSTTTIMMPMHSAAMTAVIHTAATTEAMTVPSATRLAMATSIATSMVMATVMSMAQANLTAFAITCSRKDDDNNKQGRLFNTNESVHYFHHLDTDSCHGCINQSSLLNCLESVPALDIVPPPWVQVFSKSCRPSSQCMQAAFIAHLELPVHKKARHRRNWRSLKKSCKQQQILSEVIVPPSIYQNLLSASVIEKDIVVVDGGNSGNPPVLPPDGINWHCVSVLDSSHLYVLDESNPLHGLTFPRVSGVLPFIKMLHDYALAIN